MSESPRFRVGLVGAGYVSTHHIRALKSLDYVEIVAIADVDLPRAQDVAARFGIPLAVRTVVEMASTQPDVVHVLTPPAFHADIAIQAFEMACHVFVEKPMAESPADCDRMIAVAQRAGRVLSVNHSARMDPVALQALELVKKGAIDLPLSWYRARLIRPLSDFDASAAKAHLGWIPEVGVREGLALTFRPAKAEASVRAASAH